MVQILEVDFPAHYLADLDFIWPIAVTSPLEQKKERSYVSSFRSILESLLYYMTVISDLGDTNVLPLLTLLVNMPYFFCLFLPFPPFCRKKSSISFFF